MNDLILLVAVVLIDYWIGDPHRWPHPIIAVGKLIKRMETLIRYIRLDSRVGGVLLWFVTVTLVLGVLSGILTLAGMMHPFLRTVVIGYFLFASLAATSLKTEVMKVHDALASGDIDKGRKMLSWLVGRDTETLTEEEVIKGAVETTAENTVDGILAPLFYMVMGFLLGYPVQLVFLYKAVNTMDSMVGYIQEPYTRIGWFPAKMDDLFNLIPARLGSLLMVLAGGVLGLKMSGGWKILSRDHGNHKSPNAGWPEGAVAGLLDVQLGGTHTYFGQILEKPTIGDDIRPIRVQDISHACKIMYLSEVMLVVLSMIVLLIYKAV